MRTRCLPRRRPTVRVSILRSEPSPYEIRPLRPSDAASFAALLQRLSDEPGRGFFHPHPLDEPTAKRITSHRGQDVYLGCFRGRSCVGYAFLRGWDEGYELPSFGVAVRPDERANGIGRVLLEWCLSVARGRGSEGVILHVHPENQSAAGWYARWGFTRVGVREDGQVRMKLTFNRPKAE